jgi:squalene cyclase
MLADQYATYYTGAILGLLIRAGYQGDARVGRGLRWLLSMRQDDGGWTIPILTRKFDRRTIHRLTSRRSRPVEPDRSKPFSHHWTGMVLRAFAAHPRYRRSPEAKAAGLLLKERFFKPDSYGSYRAADTWLRFEYPFWWNNLVAALDTLSHLGLAGEDRSIRSALDWLRDHQEESGLWRVSYVPGARENSKTLAMGPWVTLAICRIFRRFLA